MSADRFDDADLAAYLEGDLDEVTSRRVDAALRDDPTLGRRLDRLHDVVIGLRRPDEVAAPAGLAERIRGRARASQADTAEADAGPQAAIGGAGAHVAHAHAGSPDGPAKNDQLDTRRSDRAARRRVPPSWIGGVAAAVAAVAVLGGTIVQNLGGSGDDSADMAGDSATMMESDDADRSAALESPEAGDDAADGAATEESGLGPMADESAGDTGDDAGGDDSDASDAGQSLPELPREDADAQADAAWQDLTSVEEAVAACRTAVEEATGTPAVPLPTSELRRDDGSVVIDLATVVEPEGRFFDGVVRVTIDPATCTVLAVELEPDEYR